MDFRVMAKSHNSYGGHLSLNFIGDFLLQGAPHYGEAIREITITLYLPDSGPARKTLESSLEYHNRYRLTLPKIVYRRAKGRVEIEVASEVFDGSEWERTRILALPLFTAGVNEVVAALTLLRSRLKKTDAFDLSAFLAHCEAAKRRMPTDEAALQRLATGIEAAAKARRDAMSPWEKLGVDWEEFHPNARALLDDPFFWDGADDFAPHGNDTGADLLEDYRRWLKRRDGALPLRFLERLAKQWGYPDLDGMDDEVLHEAAVALAFADIKLRGECDPDVRERAIKSIAWQRDEAHRLTDWPHRADRLAALEKLESKLKQFAR